MVHRGCRRPPADRQADLADRREPPLADLLFWLLVPVMLAMAALNTGVRMINDEHTHRFAGAEPARDIMRRKGSSIVGTAGPLGRAHVVGWQQ
jgi:hypothetical protein